MLYRSQVPSQVNAANAASVAKRRRLPCVTGHTLTMVGLLGDPACGVNHDLSVILQGDR
jgi:hypothetical protein